MFGILIFPATMQGMLLDQLPPEAGVVYIPGSNRTVTIEETVFGRLPFIRNCTKNRQKHTLSLSVKNHYLLIQDIWPDGEVLSLTHILKESTCLYASKPNKEPTGDCNNESKGLFGIGTWKYR